MWYPPGVLEAYGMALDGPGPVAWVPEPDTLCERFCAHCACSQKAVAATPCWQCGGETQPRKPAWWPHAGTNQTVRDGDSFSPTELEEQ